MVQCRVCWYTLRMPYDDDEKRDEARKRLEARMERRGGDDAKPFTLHFPNDGNDAARNQQSKRSSSDSRSSGAGRSSSGSRSSSSSRPSSGSRSSGAGRSSNAQKEPGGNKPSPIVLAAVAVVVVLLVVVFAFIVPTCSAPAQSSQSSESPSASSAASQGSQTSASSDASASAASSDSASASSAAEPVESPKRDELEEILGTETAEKLLAQAATNADALWIAAHPEAYDFDGPSVQYKVLKLAADDPLSIPYVRSFPQLYSQDGPNYDASIAMDTGSPDPSVPDTSIPHLYQWDRRWGYTVYNDDAFGMSGCGPTSMAMIYQGLTGNTDLTPYDMGEIAVENGYVIEYAGTSNDFFTDIPGRLGLSCEMISENADAITETLAEGKPIIANVGQGMFTNFGHFFVLAGLTDDGKIILNDPYSASRSSQTWDPELIANESVALYAYSL